MLDSVLSFLAAITVVVGIVALSALIRGRSRALNIRSRRQAAVILAICIVVFWASGYFSQPETEDVPGEGSQPTTEDSVEPDETIE